jgi:hypothetical protein
LKDYIDITQKNIRDARALRLPVMLRDESLLRNGQINQARKDFLALRRHCMSSEEKEALAKKEKAKGGNKKRFKGA